MKVLFLGEVGYGQTSLMRMKAMERLGHTLAFVNTIDPWKKISWMSRQIQRHIEVGPVVTELNRNVGEVAQEFKPDLVWAEKQEFLWPETVRLLRKKGALTLHYNPDPYFSVSARQTSLMNRAIGEFDVLVYCKAYEAKYYNEIVQSSIYMPLGYCDQMHRPMYPVDPKWYCSVGFIGGWDPAREMSICALRKNVRDMKIWGAYWDHTLDGRWTPRRALILRQLAGNTPFKIARSPLLDGVIQGDEIYGDDYSSAISGAKISLGFLRKTWPDQHTTRTFEIPACGSMLLAERTTEHIELFEEGKDAEFFETLDELIEKVTKYTRDERARVRIARNGYRRCRRSGYSYLHRLESTLTTLGIHNPNSSSEILGA
jgi:spore maturation protein CgeB